MINMYNYCIIAMIILANLIDMHIALVRYVKLSAIDNGCIAEGKHLAVGRYVQSSTDCGILLCQSSEGDGLRISCHRVVPYQQCADENAVHTKLDYPHCCWICVRFKECEDKKVEKKPKTQVTKKSATVSTTTTEEPEVDCNNGSSTVI